MVSKQRGFTIIEVILFLAISGLLLAGAMAGVSANINNNRFNDGVRSTTSFLQTQYSQVSSGLSDRDATLGCDSSGNITSIAPQAPGMSSDCLILGRLIRLSGSTLVSSYIVGHSTSFDRLSADDSTAILSMNPAVSTAAHTTSYEVPWNIGIAGTKIANGVSQPSVGLAIIRSPATGNVVYYAYGPISTDSPQLNQQFINSNNMNKNTDICFDDNTANRVGHVTIANGQGEEVIQTDLSGNGARCP